ncbi:hypothetical protein E5347_00080 [Clostridium sartagoforme]|uniref:Uncharacterized protein n=1 Tax=Clostridium sartagoforme TaxID=84031 RepID=A0A4S2DQ26_9CLOT|nr:hypothetical protein [Clostridium sartagoforme]TGY43244.1 hypothetical protein E5347_00080 [Clostridium sartagoforme]
MSFIELDDILSTSVLYDGYCNYSEIFKIHKPSINSLLNKSNDYNNKLYTREFLYKFRNTFTINKVTFPITKGDIISYEIYNVIDLFNNENIITKAQNISMEEDELEINLNNIELDNIKIRIISRRNIYPRADEILIIKSNS